MAGEDCAVFCDPPLLLGEMSSELVLAMEYLVEFWLVVLVVGSVASPTEFLGGTRSSI